MPNRTEPITTKTLRFFRGSDSRQIDLSGQPADSLRWHYEPLDYEGDVLWSEGYFDLARAVIAASEEYDRHACLASPFEDGDGGWDAHLWVESETLYTDNGINNNGRVVTAAEIEGASVWEAADRLVVEPLGA